MVRFTDRAGMGIRSQPRDSLQTDRTPEDRRALAITLPRDADTVGEFIGLAIAALMVGATQASAAELFQVTFQRFTLFSMTPAFLGVLVLVPGACGWDPGQQHHFLWGEHGFNGCGISF